MWDFFPAISQNIPKQEFNVFLNNPIFSQNFSSVGFPFCPQAGKIISHLGYFSCYFPKYPKWDFNDFLNNPIFSQYFLIRPHQFIILVSGRSLLEFGQNANKNANCLNLTLHFYFCLLLIKINAGQNKTCLEITNTSCVRLWLSPSFCFGSDW